MLVSMQVILLLFKVWSFKVVTILGVSQILAGKKSKRHQMKVCSPPARAPLLVAGNLLMQFF